MRYAIAGFGALDADIATTTVAALAGQLGYVPVNLGRIAEGGQLVQARNGIWGPLLFQDLFKKAQ